MHTFRAFQQSQYIPFIILVLHSDYHEYWKSLCIAHNFTIPHLLASGGETRFHSVKNGLDLIKDNDAVVAIQDAVRPLTSAAIIDKAFTHAAEHGNAVVAVPSRDSVRQLKADTSFSLLRNEIWLVQTPQTFRIAQLRNAYQQTYSAAFTDDAGVVEQSGEKIHLVEGSYQNIKITFPEDVAIAALLLKADGSKTA